VEEANPFDFAVGLDNAGAPSIGSFQRGINVSYGNVLGWGDRLAANYLNTDGSHELGFNYVLPITPQNGTLGLRFNTKTSGIIEPPFDDLDGNGSGPDIQSDSQTYEISLRQPIVRSVGPQPFDTADDLTYTEIAFGLTLSVRDSGTQILGIPIGLSDDGRTHATAVRFFQDWTRQNSRSAFGLRSQFNLGVNALGASIVPQYPALGALPDSQFFSWQGLAQWNYVLNPEIRSRYPLVQDQVLVLRGGVQLADRPLLPDEQFELGGVGTVRGYRKSALQTDNGFSASAEALFVVMTVPDVWPSLFPEADGVLQVIPFIDFGMGWDNAARVNPESGTLAAVGFGLQWQMGDLVARLDYGIPLISASERSTGNTWQENGVSFSISYSPSF
jgi:hemolysin activation/secretion protein